MSNLYGGRDSRVKKQRKETDREQNVYCVLSRVSSSSSSLYARLSLSQDRQQKEAQNTRRRLTRENAILCVETKREKRPT